MGRNVIILNDFGYVEGGASQVAISSALGLSKRDYKVIFFSSVGPLSNVLNVDGLSSVCLNQYEILKDPNRLRAGIQGLWNVRAARSLGRLLQTMDRRNTLVHLHSWTKAFSSSVVRTALNKGFPLVITLHDYFTACPNGNFFNYNDNLICKLRALSVFCMVSNCDKRNYSHKLWRVLRSIVQQRMGMMPQGVRFFIFVSQLSHNILKNYLPKAASVFFVQNPIDMPQKPRANVANNEYFIYIGRLSPEKGILPLVSTLMREKIKILVLGDGELHDPVRNTLQRQLTGWVPRDMIFNYLQKARAILVPSLVYETQSLVVQEAAAQGVPAVVADTSAARDFVVDGVTGILYSGGNFKDLLAKINLLKDNNCLVDKLGEKAYQRFWEKPPHLDRHVDELDKVYERILSQA